MQLGKKKIFFFSMTYNATIDVNNQVAVHLIGFINLTYGKINTMIMIFAFS